MSTERPHGEHSGTEPEAGREPAQQAAGSRVSLWIILALAVIGIAVYLLVDHWPHVLAALPYLAIVAIVAMHLFGHRGHGGEAAAGSHGDHGGRRKPGSDRGPSAT